ncbi:MAG: NADH-quinone oxidoreductase subunit J family protein [Nitrososphaeria archaeon]
MDIILQVVLGVLALLTAIMSIESKDIVRSILYFLLFNVVVGVTIYLLGAPYVAVFQLLVYAGGVSVLFLATLHTIGGKVKR